MKKYNLKWTSMVAAVMLLTFTTACNNEQAAEETEGMEMGEMDGMGGMEMNREAASETASAAGESSAAFAEADGLAALLPDYLDIKNALVNDDQEEAKKAAGAMLEKLGSMDKASLSQQQGEKLNSSLNQITQAQDISTLRQGFASLSDQMHQLVKEGDLAGPTLYWQHCPMALNNQGANWLSTEEKVRNPFLGQRMPGCGSVEETI